MPPLDGGQAASHGHKPEQYGGRTLDGQCNAVEARPVARAGEGEGRMSHLPFTMWRGSPPPQPPRHPAQRERPLGTAPPPRGGRAEDTPTDPPAALPRFPPHAPPGTRPSRPHRPNPVGGCDPEPGRETQELGQPPRTLDRGSTGQGQETRRGTNRLERPYWRPARVPREVRASNRQGGEWAHRRRASAHSDSRHAGRTGRATGLSPRKAQTGWNGVPAGVRKGHPEEATRNRHCEGREGRGKQWGGWGRTGTGSVSPDLLRAPSTHEHGTAPAKAVVAHSARHRPRG